MTPPALLLVCLRHSGYAVRADGGEIVISPVSKLSPDDRAVIKVHRADLLAVLEAEGVDQEREEAEEKARDEWHRLGLPTNPPDFATGPVAALVDGKWGEVANPANAADWEAHNAAMAVRWEKESKKKKHN